MTTPIADFVRAYCERNALRLHMPGHKGEHPLDITEVPGADSLYDAAGIIKESEENASALFGARTFYSTEGSSHLIRAMLHLALMGKKNRRVLAGRNAHKAFLSASALLDLDVAWLTAGETYLSCPITADDVENAIQEHQPCAVYLTSPDYLGNMVDLSAIAGVCKRHGVLLLVDNAHGAYLKFLPTSLHPMDLGADLCCDSAHKTLPVLTGGAYLHIRDENLAAQAKSALSFFGSTSPSYLILQSLDLCNLFLCDARSLLEQTLPKISECKERLKAQGYRFIGDEPLKFTLDCKAYGYNGFDLCALLDEQNIVCEFSDADFLVLMLPIRDTESALRQLESVLVSIPKRTPIESVPVKATHPKRVCSIREAMFSQSETVSVKDSVGRVLASPSVSCPPAVSIAMCGELIGEETASVLTACGIETVRVIKKPFSI
ncbi:MAG: aminotransferase class V-fold PLP-dependent enzyme [Ruminococcaceae bacterium]|nr:aminotransferase class V-fold PLP-dependent enzyme [Oscillospiraceae bacterium]